jgi:hypothetical protein
MSSFLSFHAAAAARGDGLRPELLALLKRAAVDPYADLTPRADGMIQSGPDPASSARGRIEHANPDVPPLAIENYAVRFGPIASNCAFCSSLSVE